MRRSSSRARRRRGARRRVGLHEGGGVRLPLRRVRREHLPGLPAVAVLVDRARRDPEDVGDAAAFRLALGRSMSRCTTERTSTGDRGGTSSHATARPGACTARARRSTPSGRYSSRTRSFGEWMFDSGSAKPVTIVGIPLSPSAGTIGSVPPRARAAAAGRARARTRRAASWIAGASGGDEARRRAPTSSISTLGARGRRLAQQPLDLGARSSRRPAPARDGPRSSPAPPPGAPSSGGRGVAAEDPVHVERRLGDRAQVELLGRGGVGRTAPASRSSSAPGVQLAPARPAPPPIGGTIPARSGSGSRPSRGRTPAERLASARASRSARRPVHAGVQIARAGAHSSVEVHDAARRRC